MTSRRSPEGSPHAGDHRIAAAILAGGRAARLGGAPKPLLQVGGSAILDRQLEVLSPRFSPIIVATAAAEPSSAGIDAAFEARGLIVARDRYAGRGPMAGLHAALV